MNRLFTILSFLPVLIHGVESLFGKKSGDQKRESVKSFIMTALAGAEGISGKEIVDNGAFQDGLNGAVDGFVKMFNASLWHVK